MMDKIIGFIKKHWIAVAAVALALVVLITTLCLVLGRRTPADGSESNPQGGNSQVDPANEVLGTSARNLSKSELGKLMAELYYQWGQTPLASVHPVVLGGGYISVRGAGYLPAGEVTRGTLQSLFPADDEMVLCSISGADLTATFLSDTPSNLYVFCEEITVDAAATYYVATDTYTVDQTAGKLTVVQRFTPATCPRDLLAAHVEKGGLGEGKPTTTTGNSSTDTTTTVGGGITVNTTTQNGAVTCQKHVDANNDEVCENCYGSVVVYFDLYGINDLHGKFDDTDQQVGVDELTTYLKNARMANENALFFASGDMWQGSSESNLTYGQILTDWMNALEFTAMAVGNHDYDWGEKYLEENDKTAAFPFLAINIYERASNTRVSYCDASVMVDRGGVQIGIIGAIGDCYSSISSDKTEDIYFKVGNELTALVKAESERLRQAGADFIVYLLHDGYGQSSGNAVKSVSSSAMKSYYDTALSDGYVDLVFEGHTHQGYLLKDEHGVYHMQNRGDNKGGISHAEVAINSITLKAEVKQVELISTSAYQSLADDPLVDDLLNKYADTISKADKVLGENRSYRNGDAICSTVAQLYCELGVETWGSEYDVVLGGGFLNTRSPYNISAGPVEYGDLQMVLPFDNQIVLCSIKGRYLLSRFINTNNSDYFVHLSDYGNSIKGSIDPTATYYVVVDSYTAQYAPNKLTVVKEYDPTVFARDLLADYIADGGWS